MSATNRNDLRVLDDYYATPRWAVDAILPHLGDLAGKSIVDPGCGDGAILRALPTTARLTGIERDPGRALAAMALAQTIGRMTVCNVYKADYLSWALTRAPRQFDLVIGNPPYEFAVEFAAASLRIAKVTALLLRLPWLASQGRADWMRAHTPSVFVLPKRPEFVMSVKCSKAPGRSEKKRGITGCAYEAYLPMTAPRPTACPLCASKVSVTTSDATDYMWAVWSDTPTRVTILEVP